jgi:hypothetical protein
VKKYKIRHLSQDLTVIYLQQVVNAGWRQLLMSSEYKGLTGLQGTFNLSEHRRRPAQPALSV